MKLNGFLMGLGLLLAGAGGVTPASADTFQPERGVRCDRGARVCYDRHGNPNVGLTDKYLGPSAAQSLSRRLSGNDRGGYGDRDGYSDRGGYVRDRDAAVFSPLPGVRCVRSERVCHDSSGPSYLLTAQFFGPAAADRLNQR